jgi:integrase
MNAIPMNKDFEAVTALNVYKNGRFYHYDIMVDGVRERGSTKCTDLTEACGMAQKKKELMIKKAAERRAAGDPVDASFDAIANGCWKAIKSTLRTTGERPAMRNRRREFRRTVIAFGPTIMGSKMDYNTFIGVRDRLLEEPARASKRGRPRKDPKRLAPRSINRLLLTAIRILNFGAARMGLSLPDRPLPPYHDLLLAEAQRCRYLREGPEQESLLVRCGDDLADLIRFALETGLRWNEIASLGWDAIDIVEESIRVDIKGRGHGLIAHTVFLSKTALEILDIRRTRAQSEFVFTTKAEAPCRFDDITYPKGAQVPFTYNRAHRQLSAALALAGIVDFSFHDLRRTAARRLWWDSNLEIASAFLGHKSTETTLKYLGLNPADEKAAQRHRAAQQERRRAEIRKALDAGLPAPELEDARVARIRAQFVLQEKLADRRKTLGTGSRKRGELDGDPQLR